MGGRTLLGYREEPSLNRQATTNAAAEQHFEELVRRHSRPVLAYCLRRSTHTDAHEAAADVFAVAWRKFGQVPDGEEALYWLFGVARRVLSNRERSRRRRVRLEDRIGSISEVAPAGPEAIVVRDAGDQEVIDALRRLDPTDQEVLALLVWDEVPRDEAARLLEISKETLHKRYQRALRRLERELPRPRKQRTTPPIVEEGGVT
jgi:RNA polymerase sigma-70 factor (ECF subfamily)